MAKINPMFLQNAEGKLEAYVPLQGTLLGPMPEGYVPEPIENEGVLEASEEALASQWSAGDYVPTMAMMGADDYFRSPTLTTPSDFYTRARWSQEYYEQEGLINAFMDRDVAQAIKPVEFQLPEDEEPKALKALEKWRSTLNADIGHRGGLNEFNRKLAFGLTITGMSVTLANWANIVLDGDTYMMPKTMVNFDPLAIVPDFDPLTGERIFYLKLTPQQYEGIKDSTAKGILQIIPDALDRIVENIDFLIKRLSGVTYDPTFISGGPFLRLPKEGLYSIYFNEKNNERWPMPSLTPIFSAIAMKRKLALADFSVADGMVNMLMIWEFPLGTKASDAKKVIERFVAGGRVQSHSVPAGVKLNIVTPPTDVLNSSDKFWQPVSEILAHFDFPLNSKSRGSGDVDSGPLDLATNKARLNVIRDYVVGLNDFFLAEIVVRNKWKFDVTALMPRIDLADTDAFRAFIQGLFDRGPLSHQTYLEAAGTTLDRELSRLKAEDKMELDKWMPIRPTFAQTTATGADGRPPEGGGIPKGSNDKQTRNTKSRPASSAQGNTTKEES
jgi:hypothetical protein